MQKKILRHNQRYTAAVEKLLQELETVDHSALNRTPAKGGWSAGQTAWHLLLAEELALAYVRKKLSFGDTFKTVGWSESWRMFLLKVALLLPIKFRAPQLTSDEYLPSDIKWQELAERWRTLRATWTEFFETMPSGLENKAVFKHPRAGKIGWTQMVAFLDDHLARHRKQIRRALAN